MLKDSKGHKPSHIEISEDQWKLIMEFIRDGILRKINTVRHMQTIDKLYSRKIKRKRKINEMTN